MASAEVICEAPDAWLEEAGEFLESIAVSLPGFCGKPFERRSIRLGRRRALLVSSRAGMARGSPMW
jgi:hypothetical protein